MKTREHGDDGGGGDPRARTAILVGLTGTVLLLAVVLLAAALFYRAERVQSLKKVYARPYGEIAALRCEQQERLNAYRWVSRKDGIVAIPIERAIEVVLYDLKSGRDAAGPSVTSSRTATTLATEEEP